MLKAIVQTDSNPFSGLSPDAGVFGLDFTEAWQWWLVGIWGLAFVILAFKGIMAWAAAGAAKRAGNVHDYNEALSGVKVWGMSLVGLVGLPLIFGAVLLMPGLG